MFSLFSFFLKNFEAKQSPTVIVVWAAALLKWILLNHSGLFALPHLQLLDMKIFVDTDSDIRLVRRLRRDITERGRDIEGVIKQYNKFVKPAFEQYIEPTMRLADIVVPRGKTIRLSHSLFNMQTNSFSKCTHLFFLLSLLGGGNMVAIDLIVQHVHSQLEEVSGPSTGGT